MRQGFSLVEVMLALLISAMFGGILVQVLLQLGSTSSRVSAVSSVDIQAFVAFNILEKDISGAFIPELESFEDKNAPLDSKQPPASNNKQEPLQKQDASKNIKKVEKGFESSNSPDGNLKFLTCITTNSLNVYAKAKPALARVVYALIQDQQSTKNLYDLYRYETVNLADSANFTFNEELVKTRGVLVMRNVAACSVEFLAIAQSKKDDQNSPELKSTDDKESKKEFIKSIVWESDNQAEQDVKEGKLPELPHSVILTIRVIDQRSKEYIWTGTFSPLYGLEQIVLEGNKPLAQKTVQDRAADKLGDVMYDNPLSKGLQEKFETWQPTGAGSVDKKRTAPPAPPSGGSIMQGMGQ